MSDLVGQIFQSKHRNSASLTAVTSVIPGNGLAAFNAHCWEAFVCPSLSQALFGPVGGAVLHWIGGLVDGFVFPPPLHLLPKSSIRTGHVVVPVLTCGSVGCGSSGCHCETTTLGECGQGRCFVESGPGCEASPTRTAVKGAALRVLLRRGHLIHAIPSRLTIFARFRKTPAAKEASSISIDLDAAVLNEPPSIIPSARVETPLPRFHHPLSRQGVHPLATETPPSVANHHPSLRAHESTPQLPRFRLPPPATSTKQGCQALSYLTGRVSSASITMFLTGRVQSPSITMFLFSRTESPSITMFFKRSSCFACIHRLHGHQSSDGRL